MNRIPESVTRFTSYLAESWQEVKPKGGKVTWPTLEETKASTLVVLATTVIVGLYLFAVDLVIGWGVSLFLVGGNQQ